MSILNHQFLHGGDYNPDQWLDRPDILAQDIELMKRAGVNCVSLGIFGWAALEPEEGVYRFDWLAERIQTLYENGIYTLLATPSGARPVWMAHRYPEVLRVNEHGQRAEMGGRHNHCYTSPVYRDKVWQINKRLAEAFAGHPGVLAWHISNEYSGACWCEHCQAAFRDFLKQKYGTLERLNAEWWTAFWSHTYDCWEHVLPPMPHGETETHALTLDWKRFVSHQTADFCRWETQALRAGGSTLPTTTNLMYFFGGLNYADFSEVVDFVSWDCYPDWHNAAETDAQVAARFACAHDLVRCLQRDRAPFLLMESSPSATNWQPVSRLRRPGVHALSSLQAVAHGADSVLYFQWRKGRGGSEKFHGAVVSHDATDDTRVYRDVAQLGERLRRLEPVCGSLVRPKVAVILDQENRWALEDARGPRNCGLHDLETVQRHHAALWRMGVPVDIIDMTRPLEPYQVVVAPMLYMQRAGIAEKLRAFVQRGGTLIGGYHSGLVNENDLCYEGRVPHALTDVFGLHREEIDALWDGQANWMEWQGARYALTELCERVHAESAQVLAVYGEDFYAGEPALCVNRYGEGAAYYLAANAEDRFLADFYRKVLPEAGVEPALHAELPEGVAVGAREKDGATYLFVQNYNPSPVRVALREPLTDVENDRPIPNDLALEAYGIRVLKRKRP